ncbi:MAG: hypothetical protein MUE81_03005 [Thermoflexibacter sp.]|jgi:hypothetical protein|nr:hypothetical protein [Thermoflexibacter sp.]
MKKIVIIALLLYSFSGTCQDLSPLQILLKAIETAGGDTWQSPQTLLLDGEADFFPNGRLDQKMHFDKYAMYRVYPTENNEAHKANGKVRFDAAYGDSVFFKLIFDGKQSEMFLSEVAKPYQAHFSWSNNFGFGIFRFAQNPDFQLIRLADDQVEGYDCYFIQIIDPKKNITTFGIDKETFYIRMVGFDTEVGYHHRIYSLFKKAENVNFIQPTRVRLYFKGVKWMDIDWKRFSVNQPIQDAVFTK